MQFRALGNVAVLGILAVRPVPNPCEGARTLDAMIEQADAVVIGIVTADEDCRPPDTTSSRIELPDCVGRRVYLRITKSYKGPTKKGQHLRLTMPAPGESAGLLMRMGEKHVVFAKLFGDVQDATWLARTTACMLPEATPPEPTSKQLESWKKTQRS